MFELRGWQLVWPGLVSLLDLEESHPFQTDWPSRQDKTVNLVQKLSCYAWDHMLVVHSLPRPLTGSDKNQIVPPPRVKTTLSLLVPLWTERLQDLVGLIFIRAHANSSSGFFKESYCAGWGLGRVVTLSKSIQLGVFDLSKIWLLLPCVFHLLGWSQILIIKVIVHHLKNSLNLYWHLTGDLLLTFWTHWDVSSTHESYSGIKRVKCLPGKSAAVNKWVIFKFHLCWKSSSVDGKIIFDQRRQTIKVRMTQASN